MASLGHNELSMFSSKFLGLSWIDVIFERPCVVVQNGELDVMKFGSTSSVDRYTYKYIVCICILHDLIAIFKIMLNNNGNIPPNVHSCLAILDFMATFG